MTEAYEAGQQAFNDPRNDGCDNPYQIGTEEHLEWSQGFQQQYDAYCEAFSGSEE